ncbi:DNA polymerase III subunit gamma and tau [Subtercola sp. Z020]|uniref:DNA polymerase III subunit gamma and tau n=1 Tax=Subtercola sp. Z020 TaxID=2080582 RepID=UPI000CE8BE63|nr:DNA polymerase III subunit gamma and tau [Subtercola sp. Z020]PPF82246.1 DNA polymerase III subunit gamma and tau [Subtercola sp. Z020]
MVTALYRRYRPETFGEMIGQSQVTEPLMTALRTNRVNHAYLFSGPRGCGKTTSARILARCLNCAEGPTDTPCGVCPSCVELSRDGSGSLDVVEIDAASHNGVDDARDLRERAVFAPARDRYKIFILDEAHMVTPQGFNALLKIVEEPPEHIKFIFATTEPDKVIGTIRSRTHHYPFRLIPPAQLLEYVQALCEIEGITAAPGVLPLVVRAGGGSARDTLSLLDQLIAGSESNRIEYERAVALLGYTHASLLGEVIDALGAHDSEGAFGAVDRVIQTGQDPRRFVEDLLERLRDVIIVSATRSAEGAAAVLRGMPSDDILQMQQQAALFGSAELSRTADIVNAALTEMTGATSPRLHLELMIARVLVPASDDTARGALARVERLERRVGVGADAAVTAPDVAAGAAAMPAVTAAAPSTSAAAFSAPQGSPASAGSGASALGGAASGAASTAPPQRAYSIDRPSGSFAQAGASQAGASQADVSAEEAPREPADTSHTSRPAPATPASAAPTEAATAPDGAMAEPAAPAAPTAVTFQQLKDSWPEILETVEKAKRTAWMVVYTGSVRALDGDVLTLTFPSQNDVDNFRQQQVPGQGVSEHLRQAIVDVLGLRVKFIARVDATNPAAATQAGRAAAPDAAGPSAAAPASAKPDAVPVSSQSDAAPGAPRSDAAPAARQSDAAPATSRNAAAPDTQQSAAAPASQPTTRTAGGNVPSRPGQPAAPSRAEQAADVSAPSASRAPAAVDPASRARAGAAAAVRSAAPTAPASTTSWPVVAIPTSAPEPGDEPVRAGAIVVDIPMSDIPEDIPEGAIPDYDPTVQWAGADDDIPVAAGPSDDPIAPSGSAPSPGRTGAGTSGEQPTQPAASVRRPVDRSAASDRPIPQFGEKQRYGEAVVREILGASFIEERPVAPRRAPEREG